MDISGIVVERPLESLFGSLQITAGLKSHPLLTKQIGVLAGEAFAFFETLQCRFGLAFVPQRHSQPEPKFGIAWCDANRAEILVDRMGPVSSGKVGFCQISPGQDRRRRGHDGPLQAGYRSVQIIDPA